jgi:hypothetical protein
MEKAITHKLELNIKTSGVGGVLEVDSKHLQSEMKKAKSVVATTFIINEELVRFVDGEISMVFDVGTRTKSGEDIKEPPIEILKNVQQAALELHRNLESHGCINSKEVSSPAIEMYKLQVNNKNPSVFNGINVEVLPKIDLAAPIDEEVHASVRVVSAHFQKKKIDVITAKREKFSLDLNDEMMDQVLKLIQPDRDMIIDLKFRHVVDVFGSSTEKGVVTKLFC